ncbi:IS66 family insertion sequence element accessory protein TnpB [Endozoicomonadaceae bacterium StTr2]
MIRPQPGAQVYLYAEPVDMRKSINGLAALIEEHTERSPFDTVLYVFCNRHRDKIKLLYWERNGYVLWYKRLEKFRFKWPGTKVAPILDGQTLNRLLDGFDIRPQYPFPALGYTSMT